MFNDNFVIYQTSVMQEVLATNDSYWNNANLETCFINSLGNLLEGLKKDTIWDVFFPHQVNEKFSLMLSA